MSRSWGAVIRSQGLMKANERTILKLNNLPASEVTAINQSMVYPEEPHDVQV
jgi:hypothetical protein